MACLHRDGEQALGVDARADRRDLPRRADLGQQLS
jgi:hypothetical protein